MALTDDTELDALHADWVKKTQSAAAADAALQGAFDNVAELRQTAQELAKQARLAAGVLFDRVFRGPSTEARDVEAWARVGGDSIANDFTVAKISESLKQTLDVKAAEALAAAEESVK